MRERVLLGSGAVVAAIGTAGSIAAEVVGGLPPCTLCWWQRMALYPLVLVLGVGAYEGRTQVYRTGLPLAIFGAGIAAYHSWLQLTPTLTCGSGCGTVHLRIAGVLTLPNLSFGAFSLISGILSILWFQKHQRS